MPWHDCESNMLNDGTFALHLSLHLQHLISQVLLIFSKACEKIKKINVYVILIVEKVSFQTETSLIKHQ